MPKTLTNPIPFIALLMLLSAAHANAPDPSRGVRDDGGFFTARAMREAEAVIAQVQVVHQKDLRIETFPQIPQDLLQQFQQQGKERFFEQWANDRAKNQLLDGVYILICRQPGRVQVWVGDHTAQRLFPHADRQELVNRLAASFHRRQFDAGLIGAVHFVQRQMDHQAATPPDSRVPALAPGRSAAGTEFSGRLTAQPVETSLGDYP